MLNKQNAEVLNDDGDLEVTPEMVEAGVRVYLEFCPDTGCGDKADARMVAEIFRAMQLTDALRHVPSSSKRDVHDAVIVPEVWRTIKEDDGSIHGVFYCDTRRFFGNAGIFCHDGSFLLFKVEPGA